MISYTIAEIAGISGCCIHGDHTPVIRQVCTDTRRIDLPSESLFVALRGPSHDGHRFLQEAHNAGIRSFLVAKLPEQITLFPNSSFLVAANPLTALQDLAAWHRRQFKGRIITVTGSNGKTIIKEWLAQLMQNCFHVVKSPKSYNSQIGVPLSVLNISGEEDYAVMEAGISMPGEMLHLQRILSPEIGIISNIGDAHQESFSDLPSKIKEKISLFRDCESIFSCLDHELIQAELTGAGFNGHRFTWSRNFAADLTITGEKIAGSFCHLSGTYQSKLVHLTIPFTDPASVDNLVHIWLFLLTIGYDQATLQAEVSKLEPIRMRLEQKAGINRCTLINDYYNSDIISLKIALDLLFQQTPHDRKTVILSDILQTGQSEEKLYLEISRMLENRNFHRLIGIGPAISRNRLLFAQPIQTWPSTAEFLNQLHTEEFHDQAILLKGARSFAFEQISTALEEKIHATTLEIRMNDVRYNLEQYRRLVGPEVRIMAMVKAFSYGSGGVEMAKFLANERVDYLGVAFADEGIEIRRAGIQTPVIVMSPDFQQSDMITDYHLEPEIYTWTGLHIFSKTVRNLGLNPYPVHIKLDTGMHRLGFDFRETDSLMDFLKNHPELYVKSVFSHLAASEDQENDDFTRLQIKRFSEACNHLETRITSPFLRHILNSSGIERFPDACFDMVRLGIGLYGIACTAMVSLRPIATLKTRISQIHDLPAGESVGYGRRTITVKPTRIAIIPIGYADGIDRRLGNGNHGMLVKGKTTPTIGNICMDMTIIDVSGTDAKEGDEVIVFGPSNPVTRIAETLQTIPYEVLTSISPRVKRIYQFD